MATTQPGWVTIVHNSASHLTDWCRQLSQQLKTQVIVTAARNVTGYFYLALYDLGEKKRELEFRYADDSEPVNTGAPLPFEKAPTCSDEDDLFDLENIEQYCQQLALVVQRDYGEYECTIIRKKNLPFKSRTSPGGKCGEQCSAAHQVSYWT